MEQVHPGPGAGEIDLGLTPIHLRRPRRRMDLRHEHLSHGQPQLAPTLMHVLADRHFRHLNAMLIDQTPPDPLRGMPLLPRRHQVSDKPLIDQLAVLT
jgi:hypothetical protein